MIYLRVDGDKVLASTKTNYGDKKAWNQHILALKSAKFRFNKTQKVWWMPIQLMNETVFGTLKLFVNDIYYTDYDRDLVRNYRNTLPTELKLFPAIEEIPYKDLVKHPPIKGKAPYENFQDEDIKKALRLNHFLFCWEMGCGKSFATAVVYKYLEKTQNCQKMILFTSKVGTNNLDSEMAKFCKNLEDEDTLVFSSLESFEQVKKWLPRGKKVSGSRKIFDIPEVNSKRILVFSYDAWKIVSKAYGDTERNHTLSVPLDNFFNGSEPLLCLDECHKIANPKSDRFKHLSRYYSKFNFRYAFSATPADKPEKLYSIATFLDPWLVEYMGYSDWLAKYNDLGTYFSKFAINKNKWNQELLDDLNLKMSKLSAKRAAFDVLDLPELKMVKPIILDMDEEQKKIYRFVVNDLINKAIASGKDEYGLADVIRDSFLQIQNLLENPNVCGKDSTSIKFSDEVKEMCEAYNYSENFAKLGKVDDIISDEDEEGNRGIIWYMHPKTLENLKKRYANYKPVCIEASCKDDKERKALVDEFKKNTEHKVLIASISLMNTSITVTEATYAIYLENTYSYENYFQSTGRIYRYGQKYPVRIYHMFYRNTSNMSSLLALNSKKDLVDSLFSGAKCKMSLAEIKDLFTGNFDKELYNSFEED